MPEDNTCPDLAVRKAGELFKLVRLDAHRLNNLLLVIQGNIDLLFIEHSEESGAFRDVMQALKECRDITGRLLYTGHRLSSED